MGKGDVEEVRFTVKGKAAILSIFTFLDELDLEFVINGETYPGQVYRLEFERGKNVIAGTWINFPTKKCRLHQSILITRDGSVSLPQTG